MQQTEQFDQWVILELMGRQRLAGRVTEKVIAGKGFLKVDVPATDRNPEFTRIVSPESVYAINPVTEETARFTANQINEQPIQAWDVQAFLQKSNQRALEQSSQVVEEEDNYDEPWRD